MLPFTMEPGPPQAVRTLSQDMGKEADSIVLRYRRIYCALPKHHLNSFHNKQAGGKGDSLVIELMKVVGAAATETAHFPEKEVCP